MASIAPKVSHQTGSSDREFYRFCRTALRLLLMLLAYVGFSNAYATELGPWFALATWSGAYWLVVLVHELGHAGAAVVCGWNIVVFAVGPVGYHVHNRECALIPRAKRDELAGFVLAVPTSPKVWTRWRKGWVTAGGPLASVLLSTVALVVGLREPSRSALGAAFIALALMSAAIALSSLTPSGRATRNSDIERLSQLARTSEETWLRERAIACLYGLAKYKVRLRELPTWMLSEARSTANRERGSAQWAVDALIIGIALDDPPVDVAAMRRLLDQFRIDHGGSAWLDLCDAYFTAVWEGDEQTGRQKLWRGDVDEDLRPLAFAAESAVLAREGDVEGSQTLLCKMRDAVERSPFTDHTFLDIRQQVETINRAS